MSILEIIIIIVCFAAVAGICLIAIVICTIKIKIADKEIQQMVAISNAWEDGKPIKDILKMPMPKEMRKYLEELYNEDVAMYGKEYADNVHKPQPFEEFEEQT